MNRLDVLKIFPIRQQAIIWLFVAGTITLVFFYTAWLSVHFLIFGHQAPGEVTSLIPHRSIRWTYYNPVVRFTPPNSSSVNVECQTWGFVIDLFTPKIGEKVVVIYDPDDFNQIIINNFSYLWMRPLGLFILAGLLFRTSYLIFLEAKRESRKK